jgi:hypothetical protein
MNSLGSGQEPVLDSCEHDDGGLKQFSEILGTTRLTRSKFHTEDPQLLVAAVRSIVALMTQRPGSVHPSANGT